MTPAKGASSASASAGTVRTTGTRVFTPGTVAKCSCIFGRTGARRTAPSTGRQLPAIRSTARSGPAFSEFGRRLSAGTGGEMDLDMPNSTGGGWGAAQNRCGWATQRGTGAPEGTRPGTAGVGDCPDYEPGRSRRLPLT